jgi:hypothetical protein
MTVEMENEREIGFVFQTPKTKEKSFRRTAIHSSSLSLSFLVSLDLTIQHPSASNR